MERATGDLHAALEWAVDHAEIDLSLRLVGALWRWWYTTGRIVEGRRWAEAALNRSRPAPPALRARALYTSAILASENGDTRSSLRRIRQAVLQTPVEMRKNVRVEVRHLHEEYG